jgi:hypothetical protein
MTGIGASTVARTRKIWNATSARRAAGDGFSERRDIDSPLEPRSRADSSHAVDKKEETEMRAVRARGHPDTG